MTYTDSLESSMKMVKMMMIGKRRKIEMEELERVVDQLVPLMDKKTTAQELWANDYEPHHRHFRKVVGKIAIEYRETQNAMYEFVAVYRVNHEA